MTANPDFDAEKAQIAWSYELAHAKDLDGNYINWRPRVTFEKPCVPEGSVRNLVPLAALSRRPAGDVEKLVEDVRSLHGAMSRIAALHPNDQPHYPGGARPFSTGDLRHFIGVLEKAADALTLLPSLESGQPVSDEDVAGLVAEARRMRSLLSRWYEYTLVVESAVRHSDIGNHEAICALIDDTTGWHRNVDALATLAAPVPDADAERDNWMETARQYSRNADYYRGLVEQIGRTIGPAAYICDDGSISEDVLNAKVPELVEVLSRRLARYEDGVAKVRIEELEWVRHQIFSLCESVEDQPSFDDWVKSDDRHQQGWVRGIRHEVKSIRRAMGDVLGSRIRDYHAAQHLPSPASPEAAKPRQISKTGGDR